jgi:hypothetical protein
MPTTTDQMKVARSWIGTTEDDATFNERYDRLGSLDLAIAESLRAQLAVLVLDQPSSLATPDGTSVNFAANIKALQDNLAQFLDTGGTDETTSTSIARISRTSYR